MTENRARIFPPAASLLPPAGSRSIHELLPYRLALVEEFGVDEGFRRYVEALGLPSDSRLERTRVESLAAFARIHGRPYREIYPSGQAFIVDPPPIIGPNVTRRLAGRARSFYVAALANAHVRGHSAFISVDGRLLLDYEGSELLDFDDYLALDPYVFHSAGDVAWVIVAPSADGAFVSPLGEGAPYDVRAVETIDEAFGSLLGPHSPHFGHWIAEFLPKYVTARALGELPDVPVLINDHIGGALREALEVFAPGVRVIDVSLRPVLVERLWVAPALWYEPHLENNNPRYPGTDHRCFPAERLDPMLGAMARAADAAGPASDRGERIFLARKGSNPRKLLNGRDIERIATDRGFRIVYPEDLSFAEQMRCMRDARYVVGPEGSQQYLNFFVRPGSKLCVLNHPYTLDVMTGTYLWERNGQDVTVYTGPADRLNDEPGYPFLGFRQFADYRIDPTAFASFLDGWLAENERTTITHGP